MDKYTNSAKKLLELVGGKDNIAGVTHCMTRLRFVLNNAESIDTKAIEKLEFVKGTFTQGGQFQVIIGNDVSDYYKTFKDLSGAGELTKEESKIVARKQMKPLERAVSHLAEIFVPLLPAIICGGLILGFRNLIGDIKMIDGKTLTEVYPMLAELHSFLWIPGEAIFQFLPVGVAWSTVKKFGGSPILGIVLGIALVSPQLLNAYGYAEANAAGTIEFWKFGILKIQKVGYQAQVLPALFAGWTLATLETKLNKIVPNSIKMVVVPFVALIVTLMLAYTIIGPIARMLGDGIAFGFQSLLEGPFKLLGAVLFGLLYAPLVITGVHHTFIAVDTMLIGKYGGTMIWPMIALSNIAQGSATFAMYLKARKKNETMSSVASAATISAWMGVTEPAMYGVNLKYKYPFYAAMLGSACAAVIAILFDVKAISIGVGGLPGFLSIFPNKMIAFIFAMIVAIVVPFVLVQVFSKTKLNDIPIEEDEDADELVSI